MLMTTKDGQEPFFQLLEDGEVKVEWIPTGDLLDLQAAITSALEE
jgi:hypothetical protein